MSKSQKGNDISRKRKLSKSFIDDDIMITNSTGRTIGSQELSFDINIAVGNITNQNNIIKNDNNKNTKNVTIQDSSTQDSSPSFVIQDADENDVIYDMDTTKN